MSRSPDKPDNFFMRQATRIAIGAVTLLVLLAGIMDYQQQEASKRAKEWVVHTYEVIAHTETLFGKLKDVELGQRGYILTGNEEYLDPYREALRDTAHPDATSLQQHRSIMQELALVRQMTADNPIQQSNLDEMDALVKDMLDYAADTIRIRQHHKGNIAFPYAHRGKELMDHIRALMHVIQIEESHLLALRTEADEMRTRQNFNLTLTGFGLFYFALVFSIWIYQRSRARATAQLRHYTQELERREEELKVQQEELRASNEEIEASNEELEESARLLEEQNVQITQQSEALEQSRHLAQEKAEELSRASKYKSEFLANMSHELRTPLNSLLILARSLAGNEDGNLTAEQVEEANVIHNGGLELLTLINDILDLSKVEAGQLNFTVQETPIEGILTTLRQQFEPLAKQSGVAFHIRLSDKVPEMLVTDPQRIEQVLKNLLANAFKFTKQGSVTLELKRPDPGLTLQRADLDPAHSVVFSVIDTGIGIEASRFKDIFEAFQQEDGSTDRHYGGTGLGLTIARKFTHILGGEIHVESEKGRGSTFTVILPLRTGEPAHEETGGMKNFIPESNHIPLRAMPKTEIAEFIADDRRIINEHDRTLLIVEDDADFAKTLLKIARARGYKCVVAGDGKSALLLAVEQRIDAILLDLILPDIDGMQVLDHLKHDLRTRHIPVHIISGREGESIDVPLRKGAIGYLAKPAAREAINEALGKMEFLLQSEVKQVLVVEDDKDNQLAIQALLRKKDIHLTIAGTGNDALTHIRKTRFDCVILDLHLPDMTGFEWLETMETQLAGKPPPPIIVYTAQELTEQENRQLSRHTGSIIIKGARSPERLLDEVTLFLHSVESTLSPDQQTIIRMQHDPDRMLQGRTILLVDDDLRNTFALSKMLKKRGMEVIIADNGQMALDKLAENKRIELVIMDVMMPVMNGYETMHAIRTRDWLHHLPIIALTARAMPEEQEKCMQAGANDYLTKPVDSERLLTLLRMWLFKQEMAA